MVQRSSIWLVSVAVRGACGTVVKYLTGFCRCKRSLWYSGQVFDWFLSL